MGFLIKKAVQQIVTAKISLTPTDLSTANFIYDIPEFPATPGYFWNTLFMNGEIIADIGGTILSFNALKSYLKDNTSANVVINDLSPEKRFFINYAILWKSKARKEDVIKKLYTDPHSPPEFRVNGVIRNIDAFYIIFDIKPENKLYLEPESRAKIWS